MAWPRTLVAGGVNSSVINQPNGVAGLDASGNLIANIVPRAASWASLFATAGTSNEPVDGEIVFVTDVGGGQIAKWDGTLHQPNYMNKNMANFAVAYWGMHSGATGNEPDYTGNGNLATAHGTPASGTGLVSTHRQFITASSQYFSVANSGTLQAGVIPYVMMYLVNLTNLTNTVNLMFMANVDANSAQMYNQVDSSTGLCYLVTSNGTAAKTLSGPTIASGANYLWINYADPANGLIGISVSPLSGTSLAAFTTTAYPNFFASTGSLFIGASLTPANYMAGSLEEVLIIKGYMPSAAEFEGIFQKLKIGRALIPH